MSDALILVDIQKDFLPGGPLGVPNGDDVVPIANNVLHSFGDLFDLVVATQDWHPPEHMSFASNHEDLETFDTVELDGVEQILWPEHCVQGSEGAEFADGLDTDCVDVVIKKGMDPRVDSYSAFRDNTKGHESGLKDLLDENEIDTVFVMGLATEYCVGYTALDAREYGLECVLVFDGCRGISDDDIGKVLSDLAIEGSRFISFEDLRDFING